MKKVFYLLISVYLSFWSLQTVHAHEVYVLTNDESQSMVKLPSFDFISVIQNHLAALIFAVCIGILTIVGVYVLSRKSSLIKRIRSFLIKNNKYAVLLLRIFLGSALFISAFEYSLFGPELSFANFQIWQLVMLTFFTSLAGIMIFIGFYTRVAAVYLMIIYTAVFCLKGTYVFTYLSYLGAAKFLFLTGGGEYSLDMYANKAVKKVKQFKFLKHFPVTYPHTILRVLFGLSLIYSSLYAKILHNHLALLTVEKFGLDTVMGMDAQFVVLGAALVEIAVGLLFVIGLEIGFASVVLILTMIAAMFFFGEIIWPHLILFGIPLYFILAGTQKSKPK